MVQEMTEGQELLIELLHLYGCSLPEMQRILMLCWDDRENLEMLKYMVEHQDASPETLYETALIISKSTRPESGEGEVPNR